MTSCGVGPLAKEAAEQADGFEDRQLFGELRFLQLDAEALAQSRGVGIPAQAEHFHFAGIGRSQAFADLDGGGFAGAVGTEQAEALAARDFQIEAVDRDHILVCLAKVAQAQRGIGHQTSIRRDRPGGLSYPDLRAFAQW